MPSRPRKHCSYPGCGVLLAAGWKTRCPKHAVKDTRPSSYQRGYDSNWRKVRRMYLADNPLCLDCMADGRYTPATDCHHIRKVADGGTHSFDNIMALCKTHHQQRTGRGE